jgi:hypothetical protein
VKYLISISLLIVYLVGFLQTSWDLTNLYWDKHDFNQEFLHFLDQQISQCHASDYVDEVLQQRDDKGSNAKIIITQKVKLVEFASTEKISLEANAHFINQDKSCISDPYQYDYLKLIFHPPKG